jgi:hypothetical protein
MTKLTLTRYQQMVREMEQKYGVVLDPTLADWSKQ